MTIGPEPITNTWLRSVRRGITRTSGALCREPPCLYATRREYVYKSGRSPQETSVVFPCHQVDELVEQVFSVVWTRGRLRVVLHRKGAAVNEFDSLDDAVIGAGVADLCGTERGVELLARLTLECETVVLRGYRDPAGGVVDDRHIDAAVPKHHLVGRPAQGSTEDLVAEADAEQRNAGAEHLSGDADNVVGDLLERHRRRQDMTSDAAPGEVARRVGLDAEVDGGDVEALRPIGFHDVGGRGADLAREVGAEHRWLAADPGQQFVNGRVRLISTEHAGLHGAEAAQVSHNGAGVDARDPNDPLADEFILERAGGAPVGGARRRVAHSVAGHPDLFATAFGVLVVPPGVADLRRRGHHDLSVVARVGEGFLVARHAGGEHGLAQRLPDGSERRAREDAAVLEHQHRLGRHAASSSHRAYSRRSSARNPVSISAPEGNLHLMARMPS